LVGSALIVVGKVCLKLLVQLVAIVGVVEVDVLLFDRAPEALDKRIVGGAAPAIAADAAACVQQGLLIG
jgi:hypothetical protein